VKPVPSWHNITNPERSRAHKVEQAEGRYIGSTGFQPEDSPTPPTTTKQPKNETDENQTQITKKGQANPHVNTCETHPHAPQHRQLPAPGSTSTSSLAPGPPNTPSSSTNLPRTGSFLFHAGPTKGEASRVESCRKKYRKGYLLVHSSRFQAGFRECETGRCTCEELSVFPSRGCEISSWEVVVSMLILRLGLRREPERKSRGEIRREYVPGRSSWIPVENLREVRRGRDVPTQDSRMPARSSQCPTRKKNVPGWSLRMPARNTCGDTRRKNAPARSSRGPRRRRQVSRTESICGGQVVRTLTWKASAQVYRTSAAGRVRASRVERVRPRAGRACPG
jgi:hypothetical protein